MKYCSILHRWLQECITGKLSNGSNNDQLLAIDPDLNLLTDQAHGNNCNVTDFSEWFSDLKCGAYSIHINIRSLPKNLNEFMYFIENLKSKFGFDTH